MQIRRLHSDPMNSHVICTRACRWISVKEYCDGVVVVSITRWLVAGSGNLSDALGFNVATWIVS